MVESIRPRSWPRLTRWPGFTSIEVIVPAPVNPTFSSFAACSVPVAEVVESTTPRVTVAVRTAAAGVLVPATTK